MSVSKQMDFYLYSKQTCVNHVAPGLGFFNKNFFKFFLLVAIATRILHGMEIFEMAPSKDPSHEHWKREIPPSGLRDLVYVIC